MNLENMCDAVLVVAPFSEGAWPHTVRKFVGTFPGTRRFELVFSRGRSVALRAGMRRLHRLGARNIGVLQLEQGPFGLPALSRLDLICPRCLQRILNPEQA